MSPPRAFLVKVLYSEEKKEIACQFHNGCSGKIYREQFFPYAFIPLTLKTKAFELISNKFKKQISLNEEKNSLKITAVNFSALKNFSALFGIDSVLLIEPERQFLISKKWSYFDEFIFMNKFPEKISSVSFPEIMLDSVPLNSLLREMLSSSPKSARELLHRISLSKILKISPSIVSTEKFIACEVFLQNSFFENSFSFPERIESDFLPVKREKIDVIKNNLCEMNFNQLWSSLFLKEFHNLGFDSINCNCCKPSSLNNSNLLPNSLIEVEFLSDGLMFSSFNPSFASSFHKSNPLMHARKKHQAEWGLEFPPLGPFMREERALIPLPDALNLLKEKKVKIIFDSSKLIWNCTKKNSFISSSFAELISLLNESEKLISSFNKKFIDSFALNYEKELSVSPEFAFLNFLQFSIDSLLEGIPFHLMSPFSRFYSGVLAESIDSLQNLILNEFKENLASNGARILFCSPEKALVQAKFPLSILRDFSLKSGFPSPKIVSEWSSCAV
ncbi:MAG: hypothetical protein JW703_03675 [Candidatus Diapherotrites archaeon]|nr:hypothetical protein [Candidatus Diapherotrites archaeon]